MRCNLVADTQDHEIIRVRKIKDQADLLIEHVAIKALGAKQRDVTFEQGFFSLCCLHINLCLSDLAFQRQQGHDPAFALNGVITEIDHSTDTQECRDRAPGRPEKITQVSHNPK